MKSIYFIIPAAGIGSRMQANLPKQYLMLDTETILTHTVNRFLASDWVKKGCVGIADNDPYYAYSDDDRLLKTKGGATRAETVFNALVALQTNESKEMLDDAWVLVHDAARPGLTTVELNHFIEKVLQDNHPYGGIMALPAQDTIKKVDEAQQIEATLNRDHIWLAQTPQMIPFKLLYDTLKECLMLGINVTDEASVLEYNGFFPKVYRGYTHNFKITHPGDLELMRLYFEANRE